MKASHLGFLLAAALPAMGCTNQIVTGSVGSSTGGGGATSTGTGNSTTTTTSTSTATSTGTTSPCSGPSCACASGVKRLTHSAVDKIDLLLMVDNSSSMADKQQILALAIPDLINGLVNPSCIDITTGAPAPSQPAGPTDACPSGSARAFPPVEDIHIGLVTSSLGTFGADGCPDPPATPNPACPPGTTNNDHGHLVTRSDPCGHNAPVPTYQGQGFLAWDPTQKLMPPGIQSAASLSTSITGLVTGAGQLGCGFESQNESWYRFLVDPTPYQTIALNGQNVVTSGIDNALLQQRADFLRPDSLLAIIDVTDETDTSIKEYGIYPLFAQTSTSGAVFHLPRATAACTKPPPALGPLDPCCVSCGEATPQGCQADPACTGAGAEYSDATENVSLRAFGLISHKARYGIEFFYPPSRYVSALTSATVANNSGLQVPNPIYSILPGNNGAAIVRDPSLVFYAAITGVPWQLIARQDANGTPDLVNGVSALDPTQVGGFKTSAELALLDPTHQHTFWDDIVGDPEHYVPAKSPFMQESTVPRTGVDPITNIAVLPPTSTTLNTINGHERTLPAPAGDIEYACIFPLVTPIDCSAVGAFCDCNGQATDNPLCSPNPNDNGRPTLQTSAKAYPGIKNLAIAKGMGNQGIAASICAAQVTDDTAPSFGYRPAIRAIVDRLKPSFHGACYPHALTPDVNGQVACRMIEATKAPTCDCAGAGRSPVSAETQCLQQAAQADPLYATAQWNCFCELDQASGADLQSCQNDTSSVPMNAENQPVNGWCYVSTAHGNPALVATCPADDRQTLRLLTAPAAGATVFTNCTGP